MSQEMQGWCVCGAVRYRVKAKPQAGLVCHCTLDNPDNFRIDRHIWTRSGRPWAAIPEGVEVYEKGSAGATPIRR